MPEGAQELLGVIIEIRRLRNMNKMPTPTEIAVNEARKNAYLEVLRLLDKVNSLEELEDLKANLEAKTQ